MFTKIFKKHIYYFLKKMNTTSNASNLKANYKLFDIAANLCDEKFRGIYNGKKYHEDDTESVLKRAADYNVHKMLFASGHHEDADDSYKLALKSNHYYITVGVHPCRASVILF